MTPAEKHPHLDMPSADQLRELIESMRPALSDAYLAVHQLVLDTLPEVRYAVDRTDAGIGYGARQYGYDGWGMAALAAHRAWVSLVFFRGTALDDPTGLLEGTGASVRHVKLKSLDELEVRRASIRGLLEEAARLKHTLADKTDH